MHINYISRQIITTIILVLLLLDQFNIYIIVEICSKYTWLIFVIVKIEVTIYSYIIIYHHGRSQNLFTNYFYFLEYPIDI